MLSKYHHWNVLGLAAAATMLWTLAACGRKDAAPPPPPPVVTVRQPVQREITDYREFTGRIEAVETAEVRVRVRGFLQKIHFKEGSEVNKRDLLYEIDPRTFQAELDRNEAEARRQQALLELATSEVERVAKLRGTVGAVPEEVYSQREAARESARAALEQAQAAVASAKLELEFTSIRAPIAGRIGRTLVTEGNLVGFNEPTLLTTIVRVDPVYVFFDVPEREYLNYQRRVREEGVATANDGKLPFFVALAGDEGFPYEGRLNFRDNRIDPGTGTVALRGELSNPHRVLVPGLFARVRVPLGKPRPRLLVPEIALGADQRGQFVLTVGEDGTVTQRPVQTGPGAEGMVSIEKGINAGDWVVVSGLQRARPGSVVQPKREDQPAPTAPPQNSPPPGTGASPPQSGAVPPPTASPGGTTR